CEPPKVVVKVTRIKPDPPFVTHGCRLTVDLEVTNYLSAEAIPRDSKLVPTALKGSPFLPRSSIRAKARHVRSPYCGPTICTPPARPATSNDSLIVIGTPCKGPQACRLPSARSAALPRARERSKSSTTTALSRSSYFSTRASWRSRSSRQPIFL